MGRVVLLNRRYIPGQAWTNRVLAYAKGFAEYGEDVYIYYLITDPQHTRSNLEIPGLHFVYLWEKDGFIAKRLKVVSFLKNLVRFKCQIKQGDKLFLYGLHNYQFFIAKMVNKYTRVFCESTEHPAVYGYAEGSSKLMKLIDGIKSINGLFVISQKLKEYYISQGVPKEMIEVINMFVDTERFNNLKKSTMEKYIAYCGAVSYDKDGANILIEAFSLFHKTHPDYKLKIIGKGVDSTTIERLKDLAKSLSVEEDVIFTGPISPSEMPQMLYDASILALARPNNLQAQNGFPTKLGEYLATGNPVVVTKVGDIPLFVKHQENGFLSDPIPECFAEQLTFVADNYSMAKEVGERGRKLAFTEFSYKTQTAKTLSLMNSNS